MRIKIILLLILYTVGWAGINSPYGFIFMSLTPYNLLISAALIYPVKAGWPFVWKSLGVMTGGFAVELLGVHTGFPFGEYHYLDTLGFKIREVPLLIGLNWWIMVYGSLQIARYATQQKFLQVGLAGCLMVLFDVWLEEPATHLDMWHWESAVPPLQNYSGWFGTGLLLAAFSRREFTEQVNPLAAILFVIQMAFFMGLTLTDSWPGY